MFVYSLKASTLKFFAVVCVAITAIITMIAFIPEYDGGVYEREGSVMVVSRGVGNSSFPIRFNNPREIVLVELVKK